jgi:hypothetical protein
MTHISLNQLLDLVMGKLTKKEKEKIQQHLATGCKKCAENLSWSKKVFRLTQKDDLKEPPDWMVERAIQLFKSRKKVVKLRVPTKIAATLVFDSFTQPSLAGIRKVGILGKQLLYKAESFDIDLRMVEGEKSTLSNLMGQILKRGEGFHLVTGLQVVLKKGKKKIQTAQTNQWGEFGFSDLVSGKYKIEVSLLDQRIEIKEIKI